MRSNRLRWSRLRPRRRAVTLAASVATLASSVAIVAGAGTAGASGVLTPGNLLVSTSVWTQDAAITPGTTQLPPNCGSAPAPCVTAVAAGTYPLVFNNDGVDGSFGVTQPIVLDELNPSNDSQIASSTVPNSTQAGIDLDLRPDGHQLLVEVRARPQPVDRRPVRHLHGLQRAGGRADVSNSNTPGEVDPTNTAGPDAYYRAVAQLDGNSNFQFTETNAYSGNNGRAAILDPAPIPSSPPGNGGNGASPTYKGVVVGTGTQILSPATHPKPPSHPERRRRSATSTSPSSGDAADKAAKDNNYRGLTIDNNVVYFTKGSGSNGVDTVYYLDTAGGTCPTGTGLPSPRPACRPRRPSPRRRIDHERCPRSLGEQPGPQPDQHAAS